MNAFGPPSISVSLKDDSVVELRLSGDVDTVLARQASQYWTGSLDLPQGSTMEVPIADFVEKLGWLRAVWRENGRRVELAPDISPAVEAFRKGAAKFRSLATLKTDRHNGKEIQVPNLKQGRELTPRQHENLLCLLDMENGANFSVPGAGKTLTMLSLWQILKSTSNVGDLLVVGPLSSFDAWERDLRYFFDSHGKFERYVGETLNPDSEVVIVNYEQLENPSKVDYLMGWTRSHNAALALDEAHRIKAGSRSVRWRGVKSLAQVAQRVDLLTGTPMPQGPSDLTSLLLASWPRLARSDIDERNLTRFRRNTIFVRTTKGELQLPPMEVKVISQPPSPLHREILDALADKYIGRNFLSIADARNYAKRGKAVMTALAAASNPALLVSRDFSEFEMGYSWPPKSIEDESDLSDLIQSYQSHEVPWKVKYVALRAREIAASNGKLLVWSNFIGSLGSLKAALKPWNPAVVYGAVMSDSRHHELERFRNDPECKVLIANPQTLGEGVSLHDVCHNAIFFDRTYNAGLFLQALDRIHRLGLPEDQETLVEILVSKGTIDERVSLQLNKKIRRLSAFLEDEHLVPASIPSGDEISAEDILGLDDNDFDDIAKQWGVPH